ncbi:MAG: Outer membrane usher protein FimD [Candidatus Erwinia impunctatus]|nr:Outer membrane usher protein FimD [Culicoides impunctatus]
MSYRKNYGLCGIKISNSWWKKTHATCALLPRPLAILIALQIYAAQGEIYFNPRFLSDDPSAVADLSRFENGQEIPPGTYRVDIYLNAGFIVMRDVVLNPTKEPNSSRLEPCLTRGQLTGMGVNLSSVLKENKENEKALSDECLSLETLIPEASTRFDVSQQRLYLTVPQAFLSNQSRGYIPPEMWDNGITAGLLNYNLTGNSVNQQRGSVRRYTWLNLQSGLNFGAWRLRDNSTWSHSTGGKIVIATISGSMLTAGWNAILFLSVLA